MKNKINYRNFLLFGASVLFVLAACSKDEDDRPVSNEPINFVSPDTTTIFADAGSVVDFNLYLAIDQAIDSIRGAYLIDDTMIITNLSFADMETEFFVQGYSDSSNVQTAMGSLTLPTGINDTTAFEAYFAGNTNPFIAPNYDAVRVVFKLEAADNTSYEKQLKIIIN